MLWAIKRNFRSRSGPHPGHRWRFPPFLRAANTKSPLDHGFEFLSFLPTLIRKSERTFSHPVSMAAYRADGRRLFVLTSRWPSCSTSARQAFNDPADFGRHAEYPRTTIEGGR